MKLIFLCKYEEYQTSTVTPKCSITVVIKIMQHNTHLPVWQKTCKRCTSAPNLRLRLRVWFVSQYKCDFKNSSGWAIQNTQCFSCYTDVPLVHQKVKWIRGLGGNAWCSSNAPSAKISWVLRGCRAAELVPDLMSWCAGLSQNRTPEVDPADVRSSATTRIFNFVSRLYKFTILILTSQQFMVHKLPNHPFSEVGHVFLWTKERSRKPFLGHYQDDYQINLWWCGLWLPVWMWLACLW